MHSISRKIISSALLLMCLTSSCFAIVIRHDIDDQRYLDYALQFQDSLVYIDNACAGTLISPNWVLTAAHCLANKLQRLNFVHHRAKMYRLEKIILHPEFDINNDEFNDIALIQLKDPITNGKPALLYQDTNELNKVNIFVGRGVFGDGKGGLVRGDGRERAARNSVDSVSKQWLRYTFDEPPKALDLEGISGPADSGGPAFYEKNGQLFVMGVSSFMDPGDRKHNTYNVLEFYMRVSTFFPWLHEVMRDSPAVKPLEHQLLFALRDNNLKSFTEQLQFEKLLVNRELLTEVYYQVIIHDRFQFLQILTTHDPHILAVRLFNMNLQEFALKFKRQRHFNALFKRQIETKVQYDKNSKILPLFLTQMKKSKNLLVQVQQLLAMGANVNAQLDNGDSALLIAGWSYKNLALMALLIQSGADVNTANANGDTPLIDAAYLGKKDSVKLLLTQGAKIEIKNNKGKTALHIAQEKGNQEIIQLIEKVSNGSGSKMEKN